MLIYDGWPEKFNQLRLQPKSPTSAGSTKLIENFPEDCENNSN